MHAVHRRLPFLRGRLLRRKVEFEDTGKSRLEVLYRTSLVPFHHFQSSWTLNPKRSVFDFLSVLGFNRLVHSVADSDDISRYDTDLDSQSAIDVHNILKNHRESSIDEIDRILNKCGLVLTDGLVSNVLNRNRDDWKPAYTLFKFLFRGGMTAPGHNVCYEILDILGKMRRCDEMIQVFDEMSQRDGLLNEKSYDVLLRRLAAAHKVDEAISVYKRSKEFGIEDEMVAFRGLLMWLCRYKHVEVAESLLVSRRNVIGSDMKTMNIILNGWCVLGNVSEAKRFWKDIIELKAKPDPFTYGTFINALTKKGKLGKALELFRAMWESGQKPDVVICNSIIDALCFKKRVPEALQVFQEMHDKGYSPNTSSYNSIIKHFCKIRRMDEVYKILDTMEENGGDCMPNDITYGYLLKASKSFEEVYRVLERMKKSGIKMTGDLYNLIFKLYIVWNHEEKAGALWEEMERSGLGPDKRTYTIKIHGLYMNGRTTEALRSYDEMVSKGMVPEPSTEVIVNEMKIKPEEGKRKNGARKKGKGQSSRNSRLKETIDEERTEPGFPDSDISDDDMQ